MAECILVPWPAETPEGHPEYGDMEDTRFILFPSMPFRRVVDPGNLQHPGWSKRRGTGGSAGGAPPLTKCWQLAN